MCHRCREKSAVVCFCGQGRGADDVSEEIGVKTDAAAVVLTLGQIEARITPAQAESIGRALFRASGLIGSGAARA